MGSSDSETETAPQQSGCCSNNGYLENTTLHGLPDIFNSRSKISRAIWIVALSLAAIGLIVQLTTVTLAYLEDEVGTQEKVRLPENLPSIILCPQYQFLEGPGVSPELADYLRGYFPMSTVLDQYRTATYKPLANLDELKTKGEEILAKYAYNVKNATLSLTANNYIVGHYAFIVKELKVDRLVLPQGMCYIAGPVTKKVNAQSAEFAFYIIRARTNKRSDSPSGIMYKMYAGTVDDSGAFFGFKSYDKVEAGKDYNVQVRVTKRIKYAGRKKDRCREWTKSDYLHCGSKSIDEHYGPKLGCYSGAPKSSNFEEVIREKHCNMHHGFMTFGYFHMQSDAEAQAKVAELCKVPCEQTTYDTKVDAVERNELNKTDFSLITVGLDSPAFSREIIEYPIMTFVDYLAALGGTFGLYFGASLLSFVQIVTACLEAASLRRAGRKTNNNGEGSRAKSGARKKIAQVNGREIHVS